MSFIRLFLSCCTVGGVAFAAPATTNWTSTLTYVAQNVVVLGSVSLSNIGIAGAFSGVSLPAQLLPATDPIVLPYTITFSGGTLSGNLSIPLAVFKSAGQVPGSATVTSGTRNYSGDTGSFPALTLAASGSFSTGGTITMTGTGTIMIPDTHPASVYQVLGAASYESGLAPGSLFVVEGIGLSPDGVFQAPFPLSTSFHGVSIALTPTGGGVSTSAYILNLYNQGGVNQLTAILPSSLAGGQYQMTVTNTANTPASTGVTVSKTMPGLFTQNSAGTGLAVVQNYISAAQLDINRFTTGWVNGVTISPAHPGQTLIAWATGLGPISAPDNSGAPFDRSLTSSVSVWVGGVQLPSSAVTFAGRAPGLAGVDQIDFILPSDVQTGCTVPFQVLAGNTSQIAFIAIAPDAASTACAQPGISFQQLAAFDNGATVNVGQFSLGQVLQSPPDAGWVTISGRFAQVTGFDLPALSAQYAVALPQQGCVVAVPFPPAFLSPPGVTLFPPAQRGLSLGGVGLDAGTLTLNGPSGFGAGNLVLTENSTSKGYFGSLSGISFPEGTYTLTGGGGVDAGPFSVSATPSPAFQIAGGLPGTVNRGDDLTLTWTGGLSSDSVTISGGVILYGDIGATETDFSCHTTAGSGSFIIPASILTQLPAITSAQLVDQDVDGWLSVAVLPAPVTLNIPLTAGGNAATLYQLGTQILNVNVVYQ